MNGRWIIEYGMRGKVPALMNNLMYPVMPIRCFTKNYHITVLMWSGLTMLIQVSTRLIQSKILNILIFRTVIVLIQ
jgi:hypothetical protein